MLHSISDTLLTFAAQTLNSLAIASRYTGKPVDMLELIDMVSEEADHAKTHCAPKDQTSNGKTRSQTDEALAINNANSKQCHKGKCHHCKKDSHWEHDCFTKKWAEEAAQVQSSQAAQASTSTSKPMNKPVGSTNIMSINNSDGDGFWLIKEEETHAYVYCAKLDFNMSNLDMESDINDKASCTKLASTEDKQALDLFGSDDQLVSEGRIGTLKRRPMWPHLRMRRPLTLRHTLSLTTHCTHPLSVTPQHLQESQIRRATPSKSLPRVGNTLPRGRTRCS
jgi:hypothetical protein